MIVNQVLGLSEPDFPRPGMRMATLASVSLGGRADVTLALPDRPSADGPVVVLLHGVRGSHWAWTGQGGLHQCLDRLYADPSFSRFTVVMPSDGLNGIGTGYIDRQAGRFESWIMDDLIGLLPDLAEGVTQRSPIYMGGLSMGGFGAIRMGLRHPGRVHGIAAHSVVPSVAQLVAYAGEDVGRDALAPEPSLPDLAASCATKPVLQMDCGTDDPLIEANRSLSGSFSAVGWQHSFREFPGAHTWDYWRVRVVEAFSFFDSLERQRNT